MEHILESLKRIISRWVNTNAPLIIDANPGDSIITINTTKRFKKGDEIILRNPLSGETPLYISEVLDDNRLQLASPVKFPWQVNEAAIVEKTFYQNFIQGIYIGTPDPIPMFPAITIEASNASSEWLTIDSTKETYQVKIHIYVQSANQEDAYKFLLKMAKTVQNGLKKNIYPLVAPYDVVVPTVDIANGDEYITIADTSIFNLQTKNRLLIEDLYKTQEFKILEIVDSTTIRIAPAVCYDFDITDNTKLIVAHRFFYNSWPENIDFGTIFKGTMLKGATLSWFAWEEELQEDKAIDVSLT
ncbi:MAG: hypothetical protein WDA06_00210 [Phenylobacterium sp.]